MPKPLQARSVEESGAKPEPEIQQPPPNSIRTRWAVIIGSVIVLAAAGLGIYKFNHKPLSVPAKSVPKASSQQPASDPLTIAAMRARAYPASAISTEQNLGEQGGYTNWVVSYRSDGLKLQALMSLPDGPPPAAGWPVIILCHGYINPADYRTAGPEYQDFIAAFTHAGYMVVKPDYRGHGQSQGIPEGGHFSPVYAYDVLNLVASLKQYNGVNPGRIGLFGHSLGGHVALRTTVVSKDIKATVLAAGVVGSMDDIFYHWPNSPMPFDQPQAVVQGKKQALINKYGEPKANPAFWNSVSAINYVKGATSAVQVNHDAGDSVVPALFSEHLASALSAAGQPMEYHVYPGDDHQFSRNRAQLLQNARAFYQAHL